jgi:hypothetical protein
MQVIDQEEQARIAGGGPDEDARQFLVDPSKAE